MLCRFFGTKCAPLRRGEVCNRRQFQGSGSSTQLSSISGALCRFVETKWLCLHQDVQEAIHSRRPQQAGIQPRRLQEARECGTVVNFRGLDHQSVKLSPISRVLCSFVGTKCDLLQELCTKLWPVLPESLPEYSPRSARIAARILARICPRTPAQNCCRNAARITARIFTQVCPNAENRTGSV